MPATPQPCRAFRMARDAQCEGTTAAALADRKERLRCADWTDLDVRT